MWESNNVLLNNNCFREWRCVLQRGDVLVILKQAENNYLECQRGEGTGRVHPSQMRIVTPLEERPRSRPDVRKASLLCNVPVTHGGTIVELLIRSFPPQVSFISSIILTRVEITVAVCSNSGVNGPNDVGTDCRVFCPLYVVRAWTVADFSPEKVARSFK